MHDEELAEESENAASALTEIELRQFYGIWQITAQNKHDNKPEWSRRSHRLSFLHIYVFTYQPNKNTCQLHDVLPYQ